MPLTMTVRPPLTLPVIMPLTRIAVVERLVEVVPGGDALGLVAGQAGLAVAVFELLDGDLNVIADFGGQFAAIGAEFLDGNVALGLEAGVDDHEILVDPHDFGGDDFTGAHFLAIEAFLEQGGKAFLEGNRGGSGHM
jgi:hypothetical protein